ncbi:hypothetical protein [Thalassotalea montiporae]
MKYPNQEATNADKNQSNFSVPPVLFDINVSTQGATVNKSNRTKIIIGEMINSPKINSFLLNFLIHFIFHPIAAMHTDE